MTQFRMKQAADLLGISADPLRRRAGTGRLAAAIRDGAGRRLDGADLAAFAAQRAHAGADPSPMACSARKRFVGLVTKVTSNTVMSQVEMGCGGLRGVSLRRTAAVRELGLAPGVLAVAAVKATTAIVVAPEAAR